ncbi:Zn(2)-C6 fungal-type domain-containing protein [Abortiporus biennis]
MDAGPPHNENGTHNGQGFKFSTPTVQNQIHELAKTLPPPRKQNTACDACRSRKVKCNQLPGEDKCQHCLTKNYPCTHYVQQATSEKKRAQSTTKRPRTTSNSNAGAAGPSRTPETLSNARSHPYPLPNPLQPIVSPVFPTFSQYPRVTLTTSTKDLLAYLFSPPDPSDGTGFTNGYPRLSKAPQDAQTAYAEWGDLAAKLEAESFRADFALDLFRLRLQTSLQSSAPAISLSQKPDSPYSVSSTVGYQNGSNRNGSPIESKPLHNALVATVIAWGAKFSEHPVLAGDRRCNNGQSLFAKTIINRARELAEDLKVHRIPSADHVVIALLIEPMQNQNPDDPNGYHGFWLTSAIRLLLDLQINHKSVMSNIEDPEARGTMIFAWWMACLADAYRSVYYRRKPMLDDDDYDIDFYTVGPVAPDIVEPHSPQPSPREQLEFLGYYRAAHALARIARHMSRQLWRPATESDGIQLEVILTFYKYLQEWREEHLPRVGVPSNFHADWDFVSAVTACASDATYHIMWIILFNALDDFGVREVNDIVRTGSPGNALPNHLQIENLKRKIAEEAMHGALRIAGLAGVLTSNGYLKLDSAVMHVSCIQAGTLLARIARPEVQNCIDGLEQYSYAYEECAEQAAEIKRIYAQACAGEIELNHMASVAPPPGTGIYEQTLTSMEVAGNAVMNGVMNHPSMYTTQYQV